jgi:hypothetical protein
VDQEEDREKGVDQEEDQGQGVDQEVEETEAAMTMSPVPGRIRIFTP